MKYIFRFIHIGRLRFESIFRFLHVQIDLFLGSSILMMFFCFLLIYGCKKDGPSSDDILQGNQAFHASAVAGYQTLGAGVSYPFKALQLASPTGSVIHGLSFTNNLLHLIGSTIHKNTSVLIDPLEFVPYLNLYGGYGFNGNILLMSFYSDAAGTQSAGSITVTLPTDITNPLDPTSYASYPANITIDLNITGGNLPCTGSLLIVFTGGSGANTMTGTNTLTRNNIVYTLNLALDNQMNATGTITIQESGAIIEATNVQGQAFGDLSCDITINPYGWTGTGELNLITGSISAWVNTGTGTSSATSDSLGNLNINYADGTREIVVNALSANLTGGGTQTGVPASVIATGGTPQSALINTTFTSPLVATVKDINGIPLSGVTVSFTAPSTGQSGTFTSGTTIKAATTNADGQAQLSITANSTAGEYNVTASVAGVSTTAIFTLTNTNGSTYPGYNEPIFFSSSQRTIVSINNNGNSIGYIPPSTGSGYDIPVYWPTPTSQPQLLQISEGDSSDAVVAFNDNKQIVGNGYFKYPNGDHVPTNPVYWSSPTAKPSILSVPADTWYAYATSINNNGQIVGFAITNSNHIVPLYWAGPTDTPQVLQTISGVKVAPRFIGTNGQILAGFPSTLDNGGYNLSYWSGPTAQPHVLKGLTGSIIISPNSVNTDGVIVGYCQDVNYATPVIWTNADASPQELTLPYGQGFNYAWSINATGDIVGSVLLQTGGSSGMDALIWENGQVHDIAAQTNNFSLGEAKLITDSGWILGTAYFGYNQYILIPE